MADNQNQVPIVDGQAAPPHPGNAPIPRRQQRFRVAAAPQGNVPIPIPAFPVAQGLAPMVAYADGYNSIEAPQSGLNTFLPSYLNMCSRVFLTCQRLSAHDKFLKEVFLYHPILFDLYCSFIFIYHCLAVREQVGNLSAYETTLLGDLRHNYPAGSLPVPGTLVDVLQSITATENPYSWLGNVSGSIPNQQLLQGSNHGFMINVVHKHFYPNLMCLVTQISSRISAQTHTNANFAGAYGFCYNIAGNPIASNDPERFWLQTPHFRFPPSYTERVEAQFFQQCAVPGANPVVNIAILDIPNVPANNNGNPGDLACYMGIVEYPGVARRRTRYIRWPLQAASMIATACKYISGSRFLSDISPTGLGASMHIERMIDGWAFEHRDPNGVQGTNPGAAAPINIGTHGAFRINELNATIQVRDPVASDISVQYAMLTQVNIFVDRVTNSDGVVRNIGNNGSRHGDFWDYPIAEYGPEAAVGNILISHLPNFVRSNPRRDAAE